MFYRHEAHPGRLFLEVTLGSEWGRYQNPTVLPSRQAWNGVVPERGQQGGPGLLPRPGGPGPLAVRLQPSLKRTLRTQTSSRLLQPFRLRLFMSLFSSARLSTCNGQESSVSSGHQGLRPCGPPWASAGHAALPARDTGGHDPPRAVTGAAQTSVRARREAPHSAWDPCLQQAWGSHPKLC